MKYIAGYPWVTHSCNSTPVQRFGTRTVWVHRNLYPARTPNFRSVPIPDPVSMGIGMKPVPVPIPALLVPILFYEWAKWPLNNDAMLCLTSYRRVSTWNMQAFSISPYTNTRYAQTAQTSADPEDPDFGLWTPGSEAWSIRIATKIVSLGPWVMPYPSKKFRQNPFTSLRVIRRTDRQTDHTENITSFFGGGNNALQHDNKMMSKLFCIISASLSISIASGALSLMVQNIRPYHLSVRKCELWQNGWLDPDAV